jgi:hypothetical protein
MPDPCYGIPFSSFLPGFISDELDRYCRDFQHATHGEFDKISVKTQIKIGQTLRGQFDPTYVTYGKPFTPGIPLPIDKLNLPGELTLRLWPNDWSDLGEGFKEVNVTYELYRW